jgi:endonuclease/exonuclease/phosphatase family metal-dependent hydrolase
MFLKFLVSLSLIALTCCKAARPDLSDAEISQVADDKKAKQNDEKIPARIIENEKDIPAKKSDEVTVCSFNIQFLGNSRIRKNDYLANLLTTACDVIFVQELLAAPTFWPARNDLVKDKTEEVPLFRPALTSQEKQADLKEGRVESGIVWSTYPNGDAVKFGERTTPFFEGMVKRGFSFVLSQDKTSRRTNHSNGAESEWFVAFFDPKKLSPTYPEYTTFLKEGQDSLVGGGDFIRVPHGFGFRTVDNKLDFVAVSVHLHFTFKPEVLKEIKSSYDTGAPTERAKYEHLFGPVGKLTVPEVDARQRAHELGFIRKWINERAGTLPAHEQDFLILGDMNIENTNDLQRMLKDLNMRSFNEKCVYTNASYEPDNQTSQACYDQIFFDETYLKEADLSPSGGFNVFDLTKMVPNIRDDKGKMIADPTQFRTEYSDHFPVMIKLKIPDRDDD